MGGPTPCIKTRKGWEGERRSYPIWDTERRFLVSHFYLFMTCHLFGSFVLNWFTTSNCNSRYGTPTVHGRLSYTTLSVKRRHHKKGFWVLGQLSSNFVVLLNLPPRKMSIGPIMRSLKIPVLFVSFWPFDSVRSPLTPLDCWFILYHGT